MKLRPASPEDQDFLWRAQSHAALLEAEHRFFQSRHLRPVSVDCIEGVS